MKTSETLSEKHIDMGHHRTYTEKELENQMEKAGFQRIEVRRCRGKLGDFAYAMDRKLAAIKGPFHINGIVFPLLLLLGYIDCLITSNPQYGGLIAIGRRG